ncbi:ShlB/FhaC/HecB family hemolysin secretion/activation protein, partial [Burkholderia gladioli]|nr:ShlB/FhaC/HecB family hemolysin secretion/activation protein [Burkholderia gladioli]
MTIRIPVALLSAAWLIPMTVSAQEAPRPIIPGNDQQSRQQEEARERERAVSAPGVRSAAT